jgi:hypothetical protein
MSRIMLRAMRNRLAVCTAFAAGESFSKASVR